MPNRKIYMMYKSIYELSALRKQSLIFIDRYATIKHVAITLNETGPINIEPKSNIDTIKKQYKYMQYLYIFILMGI